MKTEVSNLGKVQKCITGLAGYMFVVDTMIYMLWDKTILNGLIWTLSLTVLSLGMGIEQMSIYSKSNDKVNLCLSLVAIILFFKLLYISISKIQYFNFI